MKCLFAHISINLSTIHAKELEKIGKESAWKCKAFSMYALLMLKINVNKCASFFASPEMLIFHRAEKSGRRKVKIFIF